MPAGILRDDGVHEVRRDYRIQGCEDGLIANEKIASAARDTDAAAIECLADEFAGVARILNVVAKGQPIVGVELMIEPRKSIIVIAGLQERLQKSKRLGLGDVGWITREIGKTRVRPLLQPSGASPISAFADR